MVKVSQERITPGTVKRQATSRKSSIIGDPRRNSLALSESRQFEHTRSGSTDIGRSSFSEPSKLPHSASTGSNSGYVLAQSDSQKEKGFPLVIYHLGRSSKGVENQSFTFICPNEIERRGWIEAIDSQSNIQSNSQRTFRPTYLSEIYFSLRTSHSRVLCSTVYAQTLIVGTERGVYSTNALQQGSSSATESFTKILDLENVTQIDMISDFDILLILSGSVYDNPQTRLFTLFH